MDVSPFTAIAKITIWCSIPHEHYVVNVGERGKSMKSIGEFVYKGVDKREGGSFTNANGQAINYDMAYILKVDEITPEGIYERKLKIDKSNTTLLNKLNSLKPYDHINLSCDIVMYGSVARVIPVDLVQQNNK